MSRNLGVSKLTVSGEFTGGQIVHAQPDARYLAQPRRVTVKAGRLETKNNPRTIVINLETEPRRPHEKVCCGRGEMENR